MKSEERKIVGCAECMVGYFCHFERSRDDRGGFPQWEAREACALKGERCVFYVMDINLEVFNLETDFFGDLHCSSRFTDMLCDAQAQYGDYSELEKCPMWGMWGNEGRE